MAFCTVDEVCSEYPSFQRNAPGSVSDAQIQTWIDHAVSLVYGALAQRGIGQFINGVFTPVPAFAQQHFDFIEGLVADYAVARLGLVLQASLTLQPGEISIAGQRLKHFEKIVQEIRDKKHDAFFGVQSWMRESMGGAETDRSTAAERGENRAFSKSDWPRHM